LPVVTRMTHCGKCRHPDQMVLALVTHFRWHVPADIGGSAQVRSASHFRWYMAIHFKWHCQSHCKASRFDWLSVPVCDSLEIK